MPKKGKPTPETIHSSVICGEYSVSVATDRQHLNALVESGGATAMKNPLPIRFNGKEVVTKRTVTTYRVNGFTKDHC